MRRILATGCAAALLVGVAVSWAQEAPPEAPPTPHAPEPQKEHVWLRQLVGEWDTETLLFVDPSQPPQSFKGSESSRMVGGFWAMLEHRGEFMGEPFLGILTLGYDPDSERYVGTWVDSMSSYLWHYQGTLDASGKVLTLESEGPAPEELDRLVRYREIIEVKSADHKTFTSTLEKDGEWVTLVKVDYRRRKPTR